MNDELENLREFYDPDTVDLMQWIQQNTGQVSSVIWYSWSYSMDTAEYRTGEICILIQLILFNGYSRIQDRLVLHSDTCWSYAMDTAESRTGEFSILIQLILCNGYSRIQDRWVLYPDTVDIMQ